MKFTSSTYNIDNNNQRFTLSSWTYPQYFRFHDNLYALPDHDYDEQEDIKIVVKSVQEENDAMIWNIVPLEP